MFEKIIGIDTWVVFLETVLLLTADKERARLYFFLGMFITLALFIL